MAGFRVEQTANGRDFHVEPAGIAFIVWVTLSGAAIIAVLFARTFLENFLRIVHMYSVELVDPQVERSEERGFLWGLFHAIPDQYAIFWEVLFLLAVGMAWYCVRHLRNQSRLRRPVMFTVTRSAIVAQGKVYPLADIAELDVQVPGIPGALYSAGPSVVAGGSGEMGAVVLSSSLAAATTLRTTVAVAGAMRGIENARSLSLNLRLRGQDKPVVLAQGLTAGPAQALLEAVVDATKG